MDVTHQVVTVKTIIYILFFTPTHHLSNNVSTPLNYFSNIHMYNYNKHNICLKNFPLL